MTQAFLLGVATGGLLAGLLVNWRWHRWNHRRRIEFVRRPDAEGEVFLESKPGGDRTADTRLQL